ncbi:unnamed protein product, partial [Symbiodinium necroappetens]
FGRFHVGENGGRCSGQRPPRPLHGGGVPGAVHLHSGPGRLSGAGACEDRVWPLRDALPGASAGRALKFTDQGAGERAPFLPPPGAGASVLRGHWEVCCCPVGGFPIGQADGPVGAVGTGCELSSKCRIFTTSK